MPYQKQKEDCSMQGRLQEIEIKLQRIYAMLDQTGNEALLLTKHPNYSWITAGGKNFVANCFDAGAVAILVTKTGRYAVCNVIEAPRLRDEELLEQLGFELYVYGWEEDKLLSFVGSHVSAMEKVVADAPCGTARVAPELITPLRLQLTENELARYWHLGDFLSQGLEEYLPTVKPGMTELEIAGGISATLWKYGIEQVMHLVSADERANRYRHALPTHKRLEHNLIVSINGRYKGLVATVSRMVYFGRPDPALVRQYQDCCEMECLTMSKAAVGVDELELYHTLKQAYLDKGYPDMFAKHGQGGCQGYWPRDYMITEGSHHPIRQNQAYCFNPVVDGTKSEDPFVVTREGPVHITHPVTYPKLTYTIGGVTMERPGLLIVD